MADQRVVNFEGKTQVFPADATDAEISAALNAIPAANAASVPKAKTWTPADSEAMGLAAASKVLPAVEAFATSPTAAKTAASLSNGLTTLAGVLHGAATLNPAEVLAASKAGWAAGKGGYFLTKGAQAVAAPIASAAEKVAPYVSAASVAQGGLDLAQMAEPKRQDIGILGVGGSGSASDQATVMKSQIGNLVKSGMPIGDATRQVYNAWAKFLKDQAK